MGWYDDLLECEGLMRHHRLPPGERCVLAVLHEIASELSQATQLTEQRVGALVEGCRRPCTSMLPPDRERRMEWVSPAADDRVVAAQRARQLDDIAAEQGQRAAVESRCAQRAAVARAQAARECVPA
ncbi:MAG: hypothetical protein U1E76_16675 [Planctomycetota bacterium]